MDFLATNWLGIFGLISGLLCVWLLVKENIYTFPLGLCYAVATVVVMVEAKLYADVLLNGYYVLMNAYGWYFWLKGGNERRTDGSLEVSWQNNSQRGAGAVLVLIGTLALGWYFSRHTQADFAYLDSFTTMASFIAMWMSARKYLDSWIVWFVVDVVSVGLYLIKGQGDSNLYFYALLYVIYLWLAVLGFRAWQAHMPPHNRPMSAQ